MQMVASELYTLYTVSVSTSHVHHCTVYYCNTQFQREVSTDDVRLSDKSFYHSSSTQAQDFFANVLCALQIDMVYKAMQL